jgi:CubicO group peptidase (beta-lactamase class C family)
MTVRCKNANGTEAIKAAENPITIRHLFTMTAGFNYNHSAPALNALRERTGGQFTTREAIRAIAEEPLEFEPGESFRYSLCHDVLGGLIEVLSGMTLGEYIRKNIFEPLDMNDSFFHIPEDKRGRMMTQYMFDDELGKAVDVGFSNDHKMSDEYESGGAGIISCVADYMKFADTLCNLGTSKNGVRILSPRTVELMRTNHITPKQREGLNWIQLDGYGYGLGVRTLTDPTRGSLSPIGEFGWSGMAGTYVIIDPENKLTLFYAQQMINNQEPYVHPRIRNIVYSIL